MRDFRTASEEILKLIADMIEEFVAEVESSEDSGG
jgi:hypothetical protein